MIKIWDKKESINGCSAEEYLNSMPFFKKCSEIILFYKEDGAIINVEDANTLREILKADKSITALEVGKEYEKYLKEKSEESQQQRDNEKTDIEKLKEENKEMKQAIAELSAILAGGVQ